MEGERKKYMKRLLGIAAIMIASLTFLGCERQEGPAEEVGESLDEAAEEAGEAVED